MNLPFRRSSRHGRGRARLTPVPDRDTEALGQLTTGPADGTTWTLPPGVIRFEGRSDIGLMPPGVVAIKDWGRDTQPLAWLNNQPETRPAS